MTVNPADLPCQIDSASCNILPFYMAENLSRAVVPDFISGDIKVLQSRTISYLERGKLLHCDDMFPELCRNCWKVVRHCNEHFKMNQCLKSTTGTNCMLLLMITLQIVAISAKIYESSRKIWFSFACSSSFGPPYGEKHRQSSFSVTTHSMLKIKALFEHAYFRP